MNGIRLDRIRNAALRNAFTLIELLVVIVIAAIPAGMLFKGNLHRALEPGEDWMC